ncbi:MAG: glycosyltransferase N-terminal domain-containing protein, partial [Gemmatimonadota bacterium]
MELEVWPNLAQECRCRGIPLAVINGRLSDSSFGTYRWARWWIRPMFEGLTAVAAQTEEYAQRFRELGTPPERVTVTDTMKWDTVRLVDEVEGAAELGAALGIDPSRPVVVAGSTGPGEEDLLIRGRPPHAQLILVPRKPERFEEVARLAPGMVRRTGRPDGYGRDAGDDLGGRPMPAGGDLFLIDTMGELTKAYALADVAIIGRSFVPMGGSDPIEAVALGKPTLIGPRHENFREVVSALEEGGGIRITERPMEVAMRLLADKDEARAMADAGREVIRRRQGATVRHGQLLLSLLERGADHAVGERQGAGGGGGVGQDSEADMNGKGRPRRRLRGFILGALGIYMVAGYLTTAFRRIEVADPVSPILSLPSPERTLLSGVFSVHTERSHDARGTREQVAAAAASAGLDFVVIGDHPPDDRRPDWELWGPEFLEGVLIDGAVELRAPEAGKVLAMGVDSTFRQWEGGLGSFLGFLDTRRATSIVVHGRGPRESERWVHRRIGGVQGWEVLDLSESSRSRFRGPWSLYHLLTSLIGYPLGLADEALLHAMREGFETPAVAAYDSLRLRGPLTATAGLNVHPKLGLGPVLVPSYEPFFRTLVSHLAVAEPLPSDPASAQSVITEGFRQGELFISLGDHQAARGFRMMAVLGEGYGAHMGADVPVRSGFFLRGGFEEDPGRKMVYRILRNGREVEWILGPELEWEPTRAGLYRVEVYSYGARMGNVFFRLKPWIFANPFNLTGGGYGPR